MFDLLLQYGFFEVETYQYACINIIHVTKINIRDSNMRFKFGILGALRFLPLYLK